MMTDEKLLVLGLKSPYLLNSALCLPIDIVFTRPQFVLLNLSTVLG